FLIGGNRNSRVADLLHLNVSSIARGAYDEFGFAGAVRFAGLVKSARLVVESADAGERSKHRRLVLGVSLPTRSADGHPQRVERRTHAAFLRGVCFWLRIQVDAAAGGCSEDLPVRHVAVERNGRPIGSNRG